MSLYNRCPTSLIGLVFFLFSCGGADGPSPVDARQIEHPETESALTDSDIERDERSLADLLTVIEEQTSLSTFHDLLKQSQLLDSASGTPGLLVLAPTDEAFEALSAGIFAALTAPENGDELKHLLKYHLAVGDVHPGAFGEGPLEITSQLGPAISMQQIGDLLVVGDAVAVDIIRVVEPSAAILILDRVLLPPAE